MLSIKKLDYFAVKLHQTESKCDTAAATALFVFAQRQTAPVLFDAAQRTASNSARVAFWCISVHFCLVGNVMA